MAPYDEVSEDEISKRPTRKAPPPPSATVAAAATTSPPQRLIVGHKRRGGGDPEQQSQHSYEEIAASETASQQDLSPIYEEIPGGSRSSVSSSGSGSGRSLSSPRYVYRLVNSTSLQYNPPWALWANPKNVDTTVVVSISNHQKLIG